VFFSSNPELWLVARSYCLFTESIPRSSLGWPQMLIQSCVGIGLIQVISRRSFTRMCVSSLLLLSKVINLLGDWKETLSRCVWITTTVKLTLVSSLQVLDAPVCTGLFYSNFLCLSSGVNYWFLSRAWSNKSKDCVAHCCFIFKIVFFGLWLLIDGEMDISIGRPSTLCVFV
jgi:hypothetical protein